jgi:hypothetical protein
MGTIAFYLVAGVAFVLVELLDWKGRFEVIEKNWPKVWSAMNNRPMRLVLIVLFFGFVLKDALERFHQGDPPVLKVTLPSIPAPIVQQCAPASAPRRLESRRTLPGIGSSSARVIKSAVVANRMKAFQKVIILIENDAHTQTLAEELVASLQLGGLNARLFGTIVDPQRFSFEGIRIECNESPLSSDDLSIAAAKILVQELRDENFVANRMPPRGPAKNFIRIVLGDN